MNYHQLLPLECSVDGQQPTGYQLNILTLTVGISRHEAPSLQQAATMGPDSCLVDALMTGEALREPTILFK